MGCTEKDKTATHFISRVLLIKMAQLIHQIYFITQRVCSLKPPSAIPSLIYSTITNIFSFTPEVNLKLDLQKPYLHLIICTIGTPVCRSNTKRSLQCSTLSQYKNDNISSSSQLACVVVLSQHFANSYN